MNLNYVDILTVATIVSGSTPKGIDDSNDNKGEMPFFRVGDMNTTGNEIYMKTAKINLSKEIAEKFKLKICQSGTVIFPKRGGAIFTNKKRQLLKPSAFDLNTMGLVPNDLVDKQYFYHWFNSINLAHLADGSSVPQLNNKHISPLKIPLPPLPQQIKIAAILDAADVYRQKTKALIAKYDELTQSLFLEMFGDPVTNPKNYNLKPLSQFGNIVTGNTPSRKNESFYSSNFIEWIKTDNIPTDRTYISKAKEYLSKEGLGNGRSVKEGSLLVACIAGSIKSIGRSALTNRAVAFNQQINAIEPNEEVSSLFLYYLFKLSIGYIQDHATFGMKRMLSKGDFKKILMIKPPLKLQDQFGARVQKIEEQKNQAQSNLEKAEDLFNSLLQKAFKGELTS